MDCRVTPGNDGEASLERDVELAVAPVAHFAAPGYVFGQDLQLERRRDAGGVDDVEDRAFIRQRAHRAVDARAAGVERDEAGLEDAARLGRTGRGLHARGR